MSGCWLGNNVAHRLPQLPERKAKPLMSQTLETLAIIALKQPVTTADINGIRGIESVGTIQTLCRCKLIAREARLGSRREKRWWTTQLFLDSFALTSPDELYKEGRMEGVFASVYSGE
jgi:segregation and condensation protein B